MRKNWMIFAFLLFAIVAFQNCSSPQSASTTASGTYTGSANAPASVALAMAGALCDRLSTCNTSIDDAICMSAALSLNGLPQAFGVPSATGLVTIQQVSDAEATSGQGSLNSYELSSSISASSTCSAAIEALPCGGAAVQGAYVASTNSFAGLTQMVPATSTCASVYTH